MTTPAIEPPVCIALDTPDLDRALQLVDALAPSIEVFKVGLELFASVGPRAVEEVKSRGHRVFLDLKLSDIPNTVAGAVRAAARADADFLTVHANAGRAAVRAAVDAVGDRGPKLLIVSVLTSLGETDLAGLGIGRSVSDQVDAMAQLAADEGATGLVLAAPEVARVRVARPGFFLLVPGIRPAGAGAADQQRTGTPADVIRAGADLLVLGRVVTQADDPAAAVRQVLDDIRAARVVA